MEQLYIPEVWDDEFWQAVQELTDNIREYVEQLHQVLLQAFAPAAEILVKALEDLADDYPVKPRQKLPRPPRYAGPQNKGRLWTRQPPRLARSDCRKMRR